MKTYNSVFILVFFLFAKQGSATADSQSVIPAEEKYHQLLQLHETMQSKLQMTIEQRMQAWRFTREYWSSRKRLLATPGTIAPNTAILACWDKWRRALYPILTETQRKEFMHWQSQVDLLSETPF